jgi:hypothetical protein
LGFIKNTNNYASVTDLGRELVYSSPIEKNSKIKNAIYTNSFFHEVIKFIESNKNGIREEELREFILSISDNQAHATIPRRVKTVLSWLEYVEIIREEGELYQFNDTLETDTDEELEEESIYPINYSKEVDIKEDKFSVFELNRKIDDEKVIMNPDFQRNLVWKQHQKSQFIESIVLNVPLPPFYFKRDLNGKFIVIDGLQRTSTLKAFTDRSRSDYFKLEGLNALPELNGKYFHELEDDARSRIEDKNLLIYILQPSVPMVVVYDIFNRINTGGTQLERQEIRNCIFIGKATTSLKKLAATTEFRKAIDNGISPVRMKDREAVLRCLAFQIFDYETDYSNSMDDFLERAMKNINRMKEVELQSLEHNFIRVMQITFLFFGTNNFRFPTDYSRGRINIAIMESVYHFFAQYDNTFLENNKETIINNYYNELLVNEKYVEAIRFSTGSTYNVKARFTLANKILGNSLLYAH